MNQILILTTTESNKNKSKEIAKLLLKKKLAACVSLKDIYSIYEWEGKVEDVREVELILKSKPELKNDLIIFLEKTLSYDVPQILYKKFKYSNS